MPTYADLQREPYWNREIYTDAMRWLCTSLAKHFGTPAANAGCKGDNRHLNGGHRSQEWILNSRFCTNRTYTVEAGLTAEQLRYLSAFDFTPPSREVMLLICQRLDKAVRAGEIEELVEWFGNLDDEGPVDGYDNIRNRVATSDRSHDWHLHGRLARRSANDMSVARRLFAILTGETDMYEKYDRDRVEATWGKVQELERKLDAFIEAAKPAVDALAALAPLIRKVLGADQPSE